MTLKARQNFIDFSYMFFDFLIFWQFPAISSSFNLLLPLLFPFVISQFPINKSASLFFWFSNGKNTKKNEIITRRVDILILHLKFVNVFNILYTRYVHVRALFLFWVAAEGYETCLAVKIYFCFKTIRQSL